MVKYKRLSKYDKAKIMQLKSLGYKNKEIAKIIKCSEPTISYHLNQVRKHSNTEKEINEQFLEFIAVFFNISIFELLKRLKGLV